jgi:CRISPR system Cascade subunit CasD
MHEKKWLILDLEAPLMAFGGVVIDHVGVIRDFPALSMITGLCANALGYRRTEWERHQMLQDRLVFAARIDRAEPAGRLTDMQNSRLYESESGWTTTGRIESRNQGSSYGQKELQTHADDGKAKSRKYLTHRRKRDYHMDARVIVALRLEPDGGGLDIERLAEAMDSPARPLFIGRKPCLPARPVLAAKQEERFVMAIDAHTALCRTMRTDGQSNALLRGFWPAGEGPETGENVHRVHDLLDLRNWRSGLHGGSRRVVEGHIMSEGSQP